MGGEKPMSKSVPFWTTRRILAGALLAALLPLLAVELFPSRLYRILDTQQYLVFHNVAEFFSVMVSLSIFGVGWFTFDRSRDRQVLFLSCSFLAVGILDFMHALGYAGMPAFITPNSANKSTQYWVAVRLLMALAFLASAFIKPKGAGRWLSRGVLMTAALAIPALVFTGVTFFPSLTPATYVEGVGLTAFKKVSEYVVIGLLALASLAYWRRMSKTGDPLLAYFLAAFILCIFSELVFAIYKSVFDTFNVLGHAYKVLAFYLIYRSVFTWSVKEPYVKLSHANEQLRLEVAEHARAEAELARHREHLEELIARRTEALAGSNQELEQFGYVVSHDLQEPLRAVTGFMQLLEGKYGPQLDQDARQYIGFAAGGARRMSQMIRDLLEYSRVQSRSKELAPTDMRVVFDQARANCVAGIQETQAAVTCEPLPTVMGDHTQLVQLLQNLIGNAVKFRRGDLRPEIRVRARADGGQYVFSVSDNGIGIPADQAQQVFQLFHRLHSRDKYPGTGIGLALCRKVVERQGGRIWVESETGRGATFKFTIPTVGPL